MKQLKFRFSILTLAFVAGNCFAQAPFKLSKSIAIGGAARWDYLFVDSSQHRLYVSHATQTEVIDTKTDTLIGIIPDTAGVHGIAIANDLNIGFTSNGKDNTVTVFDLATLKVRRSIAVGTNPDAIIYVQQSHRVVTFNGRSNDATIIDAKSGKVIGNVAIGAKPEFAQLDNAGNIYFNIEDTNELGILDPIAMKITARHSLQSCDSPTGLARDNQQRFYSVCKNKMMIVSAADGKQISQVAIGAGADGVAFLDAYALSANGADGTMSVVSEMSQGKFKTVATIATAIGARTIDADVNLHKLYLPTANFTASKDGERAQGIPDTFRILVLEKQ